MIDRSHHTISTLLLAAALAATPLPTAAQSVGVTYYQSLVNKTWLSSGGVEPGALEATSRGWVANIQSSYGTVRGGKGSNGSGTVGLGLDAGVSATSRMFDGPFFGTAWALRGGWGVRRLASYSASPDRRTEMKLRYHEYVAGAEWEWRPFGEPRANTLPEGMRLVELRIGGFVGPSYRSLQSCRYEIGFLGRVDPITCPCTDPRFGDSLDSLNDGGFGGLLTEVGASLTLPVNRRLALTIDGRVSGYAFPFSTIASEVGGAGSVQANFLTGYVGMGVQVSR